MHSLRQGLGIAINNFRSWHKNPKIILSFCLGLIFCFLLSDKVVGFADKHDTILQIMEVFIWTFGDLKSILVISLILILIFSDIPNLGNEVPFVLIRTNRFVWMLGQIIYIILTTFLYTLFIMLSTFILSGRKSFTANMWSKTAAIMGYSNIGQRIAVPAFVKVLEFSFPYEVALHIFGLMLGYSLVLSGIVLLFNIIKDKAGMIAGVVFSGFGFIVNPEVILNWLHIPTERKVEANIIFGWISPLNHATYYMHNFGYDNLPRLWQSYVFFGLFSLTLFGLSLWRIRSYSFDFTGTESV